MGLLRWLKIVGKIEEWGCFAEMGTRNQCKGLLNLWLDTKLCVSRTGFSED